MGTGTCFEGPVALKGACNQLPVPIFPALGAANAA
jgi:hypothetical protein